MMRSKNLMTIVGNVGREPDIRQREDSKIVNLSVAVSESRQMKDGTTKESTEWFRIVAYRKLAEMSQKIKKGQRVCVMGKMKQSTWDDRKTGETRTGWSLEAEEIFVSVYNNTGEYVGDTEQDGDHGRMNDDELPY